MQRTLLVISLATLLHLAAAPATGLPLPGAAAWDITSDITVEGVPLVLATNIVIENGGALHLKGVSATVPLPINITIRAGGVLDLVDGIEPTSGTTQPTRLSGPMQYDVYAESGSALRVVGATLANARLDVASADATILRSTVTSGIVRVLSGGVARIDASALDTSLESLVDVLDGGAADINATTFDRAGGASAFVHPGGVLRLANATLGQSGDYGVHIEHGTARVENSTFSLSPSYALYGVGADITLVDSSFHTHCGVFLVEGTTAILARNDVRTIDHGFTLSGAGAVDITRNSFTSTQTALLLYDSLPIVHNNSFVGNTVAISTTAPPSWADVDARWNWWGDAAGPATGQVSGAATVAPWLTSAP